MSPPAKGPGEGRVEWSPLGQATLAGASAYGAYSLHQMGVAGNDLASVGAIGLGAYAALSAGRWMKAVQVARDRHRHARRLESFHASKGNARLGTVADAQRGGLCVAEGFGVGRIVGTRRELALPWECAIGVCGPPGTGKSNLLVANLLRLRVGNTPGRVVSFVANDGPLELLAVTAAAQLAMGRRPVVIGPGATEMIDQLGLSERSLGAPLAVESCNPLSWVKDGPNVVEDARTAVKILHPGIPDDKATGNQGHFDRRTRQLLLLVTLAQLAAEGRVTLAGMRRRLLQPLGLDPHIDQPRVGARGVVRVQRAEDEVAGQRRLDGVLRGLVVADLTTASSPMLCVRSATCASVRWHPAQRAPNTAWPRSTCTGFVIDSTAVKSGVTPPPASSAWSYGDE